MNDYYKVLSEYQNLYKINQINLNNLVNISIEIQTIKNGLKLFNSNFSDNNKTDNYLLPPFTTMNEAFKTFSKRLKCVLSSLEDEIVFPIETLYQNNELICKENLNSFNQMANILIENKQHLNKTMENFKQALKENNIKTNSEDDIMKKQAKIENSKQLYKYAIEKMNKIIEESNEKYNTINKGIDANDESRMAILKEILNKFKFSFDVISQFLYNVSIGNIISSSNDVIIFLIFFENNLKASFIVEKGLSKKAFCLLFSEKLELNNFKPFLIVCISIDILAKLFNLI